MYRRLAIARNLQAFSVGLLRFGDVAVVIAAGIAAYLARHDAWPPSDYLLAIVIGALVAVNYLHAFRLYEFRIVDNITAQSGPLGIACLAITLTMVTLAYVLKVSETYSRLWGGLWLVFTFFGFISLRLLMANRIRRWRERGFLTTRIAIVGSGPLATVLSKRIRGDGGRSLDVVGLFDDVPGETGAALAGTIGDLIRRARNFEVDQIIVAIDWQTNRVPQVLEQLRELAIAVKLCAGEAALHVPGIGYGMAAGIPLLDVFDQPLSGWSIVVKGLEDRIVSLALLIILSPAMLAIALLVRSTSRGPVLFRQTRYGFNNNPITVIKFRTMYRESLDAGGKRQAQRNDARVTPIGRWLRRTSLDELPQLVNVLRGEMSLVGPRPHAVAHNEHYAQIINGYLRRHRMKPGITGWAQINGLRGETDTPEKMQQRVQFDLYYIDNWSLWFDLRILMLTPLVLLVHRNAY